jgi:hypothetical protein
LNLEPCPFIRLSARLKTQGSRSKVPSLVLRALGHWKLSLEP